MMFISNDHHITLIRSPEFREFQSGVLVVTPMKTIDFRGAYYKTEDEEEIAFLRKHASFGVRIFEEVAPDDVVAVGTTVPLYVCGFPKCHFKTVSTESMTEHKQEEHSKEARERKRMAAVEEATSVMNPEIKVIKKKKTGTG